MIEPNKKLEIPNRKEDLIPFSKELVTEYGDQALSSNWFESNGYGSFVEAVRCNYDRSWKNFLKDADLGNYWDKKDLVPYMNKLLEKYGNKALSCEWLLKETKGNGGFMKALKREYGSWTQFKEKNNFGKLVEPSGLEPLTPCMPCRCSTS